MVIFTPFGSGIGFFPTRDIPYLRNCRLSPVRCPLPNVTQHFAAHALLTRALAGHYAARSGEDVDPESAQNARHFLRPDIHTAARTRYALDPRDHRLIARRVLEINANRLKVALFGELEGGDVDLILKDLRDIGFEPRRRDVHLRMVGLQPITNARQHVGDRIRCRHSSSSSSTYWPLT